MTNGRLSKRPARASRMDCGLGMGLVSASHVNNEAYSQLTVLGLPDNHTVLGQSELPEILTGLLTQASRGNLNGESGNNGATKSGIPSSPASAAAAYELLRVGANLCMDHGECRMLSRKLG